MTESKIEYDVFIRLPEMIEDGQELGMILRDIRTFEHIPARVRVFKSFEAHPDKHKLSLKTPLGLLTTEKPWAIDILERLDDDALLDDQLFLCAEFKGKGIM